MATTINFPPTPSVDDTYVYGNITYVWDGTIWHPQYISDAKVVGITQLSDELTAVVDMATGTEVDWSLGIQFLKTMTGDTTLTFANTVDGKTISLIIDGNFVLTLPAGIVVDDLSAWDGTATNVLHITCINNVTPLYSVTSKAY